VKIIKANLFRNTELFGQMDPFIVVEHNKKKYKTPIIDKGGMTPVWNHSFIISQTSLDDVIKIICFDEDFIVHDFVGETTVLISSIIKGPGVEHWVPIYHKLQKSGEVLVEASVLGDDSKASKL
jgi:Ca2+-dependent lipid-binding protein